MSILTTTRPTNTEEIPAQSAAPTIPSPTTATARSERSEATRRILAQIATLSDQQEIDRLVHEVVDLNMGIAEGIARRYRGRGIDLDDLVQVAYVGLVKAARAFDPSHERDFLSFAVPTIAGEVKRYFRDHGWVVRPTRRLQELAPRIVSASDELTQVLGRSPRPSEIAEELEVDVDWVIESLASDGCFSPTSLDVPVGEDGVTMLADRLGEDDSAFERAEARLLLGSAVRQLSERDRQIIELRFFRGWTQEQVGAAIGVSQMQVSRLLRRILVDLRTQIAS